MAYQASVNNGLRYRRPESILTNIAEVGEDVATLAELQLKLAAVDARDTLARASVPTVVLVASAAVLVATVPVLLIGLAFVLAAAFGISQGAALLIVGLVVAAIVGVVGWLALTTFMKSFESFRRTREELNRNVSWVRTVLAQSTRSAQRPKG